MVKVLFKRLDPKAQIPKYKTNGSSGLDLMALIEGPIKIKAQESALIPTGISVEMSLRGNLNLFFGLNSAPNSDIKSINFFIFLFFKEWSPLIFISMSGVVLNMPIKSSF